MEVIGSLVAGADGDAKTERFRHGRHGGDDGQRLVDGPLRAGDDGGLERVAVDVVAAEDVGDEDAVKFGGFEKLGQLDPVMDGGEVVGLVGRVTPEAGGLVAGACWRGAVVSGFGFDSW